jgi:hypothetical protein
MAQKDKELLDLLKSYGLTDEDIKDGIMKGNIKVGGDDEEEVPAKEEKEKEAPESSEEELEMEKGKKKKEEPAKEEAKIEKSEVEADLIKSFDEKFESIGTKLDEVTLLKSQVEELTDLIKSMGESIEKISGTPNPQRYVGNVNFLEKGGVKDEEGKTVLSVSRQKEDVENLLMKAIDDESDSIFKSQLEEDLVNLNTAGIEPTASTAMYFFKEKGIRLQK